VEANIKAAAELGVEVAKLGACPWIPHANTALPAFEHVQPYQFWIDATELQRQKCDALLTVEGWERSSGARGEVSAAREAGQPVFHNLADLAEWIASYP
jgi:hypothetical protein